MDRLRGTLSRLIDPILPLLFEERTTYVAGFSEEAFHALPAGSNEEVVRRSLGHPLSVRELADGRRILYYSQQASPRVNYVVRNIVLDAQGRLIERHAEFYLD